MSTALSPPLHFDAVLRPHRSLGRAGFWWLMAGNGIVTLIIGSRFLVLGAWPVTAFYLIDLLLIYGAFRLSYRSGRLLETVQLSETELKICRIDPEGRLTAWSFQPYWVRVRIADPPQDDSQITVTSHGKMVVIGSFLSLDERVELARALIRALRPLRAGSGMAPEEGAAPPLPP